MEKANRQILGRIGIGLAIVGIAALDWMVSTAFAPFFSIPVMLSAWTGGWPAGTGAAALCSIVLFAGPQHSAFANRISEAGALGCLGVTAGLISSRERREKQQYQQAAEQISTVYEKVQANFESMKRVEKLSAIGQLSAGLAHEIRNPLASISGAAAIMQRSGNLDPKQIKCIGIITKECERLDGLLTNFLNFARPRAPRFQTVAIGTVLDNVMALASHGSRGKTLHLEKQLEPDLEPVLCDPEQLEQVLLNLMINAMEASPDGGTVLLSASNDGGRVAVRVIDHGHGVAPAHIDRLFDPFFTTKEHGTGLGLPVAHQIMTQMRGDLVAQRNEGSGMMFSVILPARRGEA